MKKTGRKPITNEKINLINKLNKQGYSSNEISKKLDISVRTVINYKENKQKTKNISLETKKLIKKLSKNQNISQISRQLGICRQTVRNYIN